MANISSTWITEFSKYNSSDNTTLWFSFDDRNKDLAKENSQYQEFIVKTLVHINNSLYGSVENKHRHTFQNFEQFTKKYLDVIVFPIYHFTMNIKDNYDFKMVAKKSIIKPILCLKGTKLNCLNSQDTDKMQYVVLGLLHVDELYNIIKTSKTGLINLKRPDNSLKTIINDCFIPSKLLIKKNQLMCEFSAKYQYLYPKGMKKKYLDMAMKDHCFIIIYSEKYSCKSVLYYNTLIQNN